MSEWNDELRFWGATVPEVFAAVAEVISQAALQQHLGTSVTLTTRLDGVVAVALHENYDKMKWPPFPDGWVVVDQGFLSKGIDSDWFRVWRGADLVYSMAQFEGHLSLTLFSKEIFADEYGWVSGAAPPRKDHVFDRFVDLRDEALKALATALGPAAVVLSQQDTSSTGPDVESPNQQDTTSTWPDVASRDEDEVPF